MALDFRRPDRDQSFLLPPSMREWLPDDHLVWFVLETVDGLDMSGFEARARLGGAGRAPFDPRTLLAVLIYGYAHAQRSSRQLERLCSVDVAFRIITGNEVPDHSTLARFRARHDEQISGLFTQVLVMCAKAGLGDLGVVAIDGTKIMANASKDANADADRLRKRLAAEVKAILGEAAAVDAAEDELYGDARGDELPSELADPKTRKARIRELLDEVEAEQAQAQAVDRKAAEYEQYLAAGGTPPRARNTPKGTDPVVVAQAALERELAINEARWAAHEQRVAQAASGIRKTANRPPLAAEQTVRVIKARQRVAHARKRKAATAARAPQRVKAKAYRNMTDPDSRLQPVRGGGFIQGFNAQLAVSDDQIITAATITANPNDAPEFIPMLAAVQAAAELMDQHRGQPQGIGVVQADAGYAGDANLTAPGPDRLIALGKRRTMQSQAKSDPASGPPPPDATPREAMGHRLRTEAGRATYRRRAMTVEPVNSHIKDRIGLRRFSRRGLTAATSELQLASAVANLLKLYRARLA